MEPEKKSLEKEVPLGKPSFFRFQPFNFGGVLGSNHQLPCFFLALRGEPPGFDFNGDGDLSFEEFFELFAARTRSPLGHCCCEVEVFNQQKKTNRWGTTCHDSSRKEVFFLKEWRLIIFDNSSSMVVWLCIFQICSVQLIGNAGSVLQWDRWKVPVFFCWQSFSWALFGHFAGTFIFKGSP